MIPGITASRRMALMPTPILDLYPGAALAYSSRKLRSDYTGSAIRVSDLTSQADIGFTPSGELDIAALTAFAGSNPNIYVVKWYDQSGSGRDAVTGDNSSAPRIVQDGSLVLRNGKPGVLFNTINCFLQISNRPGVTQTYSAFCVGFVAPGVYADNGLAFLGPDSPGGPLFQVGAVAAGVSTAQAYVIRSYQAGLAGSGVFVSGRVAQCTYLTTAASTAVYVDSAYAGYGGSPGFSHPISFVSRNYYNTIGMFSDAINEIICFTTDQSGNRLLIEADQQGFYSIV